MALFRRQPRVVRLESPVIEPVASQAPWRLWSDGLGQTAVRVLQIMIVIAFAALVVLGARTLSVVIIPVVLALILACAAWPLVHALRSRGVPAILATLITLVGAAIVLGGLGWLIVWSVRSQWSDLYAQAEDGLQDFLAWVEQLPFAPSADQLNEWRGQIVDFLTSAQFGSGALAGVGVVANFLTGAVLLLVVLFFFLKDGPAMWAFLLRPFRGASYDRARRVGAKTVVVLGSYLRGTASVAAVDAVGIFIGLLILQVPLAVPLAVLVFLLAFIPIVGATLAGILGALVALVSNGWVDALGVVGVVVLVNQLEGNFLQPVLMGRSMRLDSFVILIALAIGAVVGGVLGAVLAVPVTATVWGAITVWDGPDLPARWARPKRRDRHLAAEQA